MRTWGLTLVRLLVTWEAISHEGPYPEFPIDQDYVSYLQELLTIFSKHGLKCIVNAHQDVWSRLCGGSGAPAWVRLTVHIQTFRAAGLDIHRLLVTGAALIPDGHGPQLCSKPSRQQLEPTGPFNWPSGYQKMAPATMNTLFWAGSVFAPHLNLLRDTAGQPLPPEKAMNIQHFLQKAYMDAFVALVTQLSPCSALIGFEVRVLWFLISAYE